MQDSKPVDVVTSLRGLLSNKESALHAEEQGIFRSIIGSLLYIAVNTRSEIAVAARALGSFVADPSKSHIKAAKRLLRYLGVTKEFVFMMRVGGEHQITVCGEENRGGESGSYRRSRTSIVMCYRNAPISISCCNQKDVSLSLSEAKNMPLSQACNIIAWLKQVGTAFILAQQ